MLTRTAFSIASAAAIAGAASAQQATIRPWPGSTNSNPAPAFTAPAQNSSPFTAAPDQFTGVPVAPPQSLGISGPAGWTTTGQAGASTQPIHTLYYRKETENQGRATLPLEAARPAPANGIRLAQAANVQEQAPPPRLEESYRPPRDELFLLDSEAAYVQRQNVIRRRDDARLPKESQRPVVIFPAHEGATTQPYAGRCFQPSLEQIEPNYVVYGRLFFENKNSERYGWELGALQPYYAAGKLLWDTSVLPYRLFSFPRLDYDSNAGLCLPGDPVPMLLYSPELSVSGGLAQVSWIGAMIAIVR